MKPWPSPEAIDAAVTLPKGARLRAFTESELRALPTLLAEWYPTVQVGAESVFLDPHVLETAVARPDAPERPYLALCIELAGAVVGFQAFERQPAARALHGRLGVLAPAARAGFLGAMGFPLFEALGGLMEAELLMVWVTLASKTQQVLAERRGFRLVGLVPGFDRDAMPDGRVERVAEALYCKNLGSGAPPQWPDVRHLTEATRRMLELVRGDVR